MKDTLNITPLNENKDVHKLWFINAPYSGHLLFNGEPTSLLYAISSTIEVLRKNEIKNLSIDEVALINPKLPFPYFKNDLEKLISNQKLKLVAISTTTASCIEARRIAQLIKSYDRDIIIIFGGPHEDDLNDNEKSSLIDEFEDYIDFSVAGDGEFILLKLIRTVFEKNIYSPEDLKNFILQNSREFKEVTGVGKLFFKYKNSDTFIEYVKPINIDKIPIIPRELLNENDTKSFDIFLKHGHSVKTAQILTERGCPWNCIFCSESTKAGKDTDVLPSSDYSLNTKSRSIESVIKEIRIALDFSNHCKNNFNLFRKDYKAIFFDDSTFTHTYSNRRTYLNRLLSALKELRKEFDFEWGCQTRIDQIDENILAEMINAGCTYIYIGLESINNRILKQMAKGMTNQQILSSFEMIEKVNKKHNNVLRIGISLVFGLTSIKNNKLVEDKSSVDETLNFITSLNKRNLISIVSINSAVFYPGTLMTKYSPIKFDFHYRDGIPKNTYPWNRFEEGPGYHADDFTFDLADYIVKKSNFLFGEVLVNQDIYNVPVISRIYWESKSESEVVYLNHASIMKPETEVIERVNQAKDKDTNSIIENTRTKTAQLFNSNNINQIVFGRNTSEACSLAIWLSRQLNLNISKILLTDIENYSILRVVNEYSDHANVDGRYRWASYPTIGRESYKFIPNQRLSRNLDVNYLRTNGDLTKLEDLILESAIQKKPDIIIISHVERTTGRITDLKYLIPKLREINHSLYIIVDGAKAFGALATIDFEEIDTDFYLAAPHFTLGSYPVGILLISERLLNEINNNKIILPDSNIIPILHGMFSDELKLKNVSENLNFSDISSLYEAISLLEGKKLIDSGDFSKLNNIRKVLKEYFIKRLSEEISGAKILSPLNESYVNFICSFTIEDLDLHSITFELWLKYKICISYVSKYNLIRISFNYTNTYSQIDFLVSALKELVNKSNNGQ